MDGIFLNNSGDFNRDYGFLGDSATRIKHKGEFVYEFLLSNQLGLEIIQLLEDISLDHTIIASTRSGAVIKDTLSPEEAAIGAFLKEHSAAPKKAVDIVLNG